MPGVSRNFSAEEFAAEAGLSIDRIEWMRASASSRLVKVEASVSGTSSG
jgi:hypothetical protein